MALIWNPFILKMSGYWDRAEKAIRSCYGCSQASPLFEGLTSTLRNKMWDILKYDSLSAARSIKCRCHSLPHSREWVCRVRKASCWSRLFLAMDLARWKSGSWESMRLGPSCPSCPSEHPCQVTSLTHPCPCEGQEAFPGHQTIPTNWLFNWLSYFIPASSHWSVRTH